MRPFLASLVLLSPILAFGDEPLDPPKTHEIWSPNGTYCAIIDVEKDRTSVYEAGPNGRRSLRWTMDGWHRAAWLSSSGDALATEYEGLNLLSSTYSASDELLSFYVKGKKIGAVTVGSLFPKGKGLARTVSHFAWGTVSGQETSDVVRLETVDGRKFRFDMKNGKVSTSQPQPLSSFEPAAVCEDLAIRGKELNEVVERAGDEKAVQKAGSEAGTPTSQTSRSSTSDDSAKRKK